MVGADETTELCQQTLVKKVILSFLARNLALKITLLFLIFRFRLFIKNFELQFHKVDLTINSFSKEHKVRKKFE